MALTSPGKFSSARAANVYGARASRSSEDAAATTPAPAVEVRVLGANNVGIAAYSDADGSVF